MDVSSRKSVSSKQQNISLPTPLVAWSIHGFRVLKAPLLHSESLMPLPLKAASTCTQLHTDSNASRPVAVPNAVHPLEDSVFGYTATNPLTHIDHRNTARARDPQMSFSKPLDPVHHDCSEPALFCACHSIDNNVYPRHPDSTISGPLCTTKRWRSNQSLCSRIINTKSSDEIKMLKLALKTDGASRIFVVLTFFMRKAQCELTRCSAASPGSQIQTPPRYLSDR